ncbi:hypothetical protein OXIME_000479 [Oxyplasma meridianum]|uniref:Uncharacterized protein n=1 Tax=Oxyplasma meridianum TaxID=3073602 RepID=A0AAX4NEN0_9ARCH
MISGDEKRYSKNVFDLLKRDILRARDSIIFNHGYIKFIKRKRNNKENILINTLIYVIAYPFSLFHKKDKIEDRIKRIKAKNIL